MMPAWASTAGLLGLSALTAPPGKLDHHDVSGFGGYFLKKVIFNFH